RQNRLREGENGEPNDIQKIVDTYQFRREEPRYSKRVSLERIEQEDFNLNITRYVSTAQEEEPIDLQKVNDELKEIARRSKETLDRHNEFLKELGLPPIAD
ncbi:N-6 DNA methylase, partial [Alistipes communis]